jgi:hypothetical protein
VIYLTYFSFDDSSADESPFYNIVYHEKHKTIAANLSLLWQLLVAGQGNELLPIPKLQRLCIQILLIYKI